MPFTPASPSHPAPGPGPRCARRAFHLDASRCGPGRARTASSSSRMSAQIPGPVGHGVAAGPGFPRPRQAALAAAQLAGELADGVLVGATRALPQRRLAQLPAVLCSSSSSRSPGAKVPGSPRRQAASGVHRKRLKRGTGGSGCALPPAPRSVGPAEPLAPQRAQAALRASGTRWRRPRRCRRRRAAPARAGRQGHAGDDADDGTEERQASRPAARPGTSA